MSNKKTRPGKVYLVGAGPGDPGLITVKGIDALRRADVIVHDYLANPRLLSEARTDAKMIFVGKRHDIHLMEQAEINQVLVREAKAGNMVVRLKGGDPFIFGRGGEEAETLANAGIDFEIVPGVTAAVAVPSYAGIPLTHRDFASDVAFITGQESVDKPRSDLDWDKLARGVGTLVFLMGVKNLSHITAELIKHGRDPETPAAVIRWGTLPDQRTLVGTVRDIAGMVSDDELRPPAVTVVGEVVALRKKLAWFESRPLIGKAVVVTRPRSQSVELMRALEEAGAAVVEFPAIQTVPVADYSILDGAISELETYDWTIFTSANGVAYFFDRLRFAGKDVRELKGVKIAAIGPATARRLRDLDLRVDMIPENYLAEGLLDEFAKIGIAGKRILLPRAKQAREILPEKMKEMGAEVITAPAYETVTAATDTAPLRRRLEAGLVSWITFTSASTVKNFVKLLGADETHRLLAGVRVAAIGPISATAAKKLGIDVDVIARESTTSGLVAAIMENEGKGERGKGKGKA